tara:strand:+ start:155 stop:346 length:192 start_codon:yes stop_codon:yes gene_type:complete
MEEVKIGDLIVDLLYPEEVGIILDKRDSDVATYKILNIFGHATWFERKYIEDECEVVSGPITR